MTLVSAVAGLVGCQSGAGRTRALAGVDGVRPPHQICSHLYDPGCSAAGA